MRANLFGKANVGDKVILQLVKDSLRLDSEYLGEKVDLSRITVADQNLILVINPSLYHLDLDRVLAYIKKDLSKPLITIKKLKTFGALLFKENYQIDRITANKVYVFAGILYLPRVCLENKKTVAEIFRTVPLDDWRVYSVTSD